MPIRTAPFRYLIAALALLASLPAGAQDTDKARLGTVAIAADLATAGAATTLTLTLSSEVEARAFVMERPDRAVIDLPEVNFQLGPESGRKREGVVTSFRYGLFAPGRSRIVVDLAGPALIDKIQSTKSRSGAVLLSIVFRRAERDAFASAAVASDPAPSPRKAPPAQDAGDTRPLIVVDAGHGGIDPGASAPGGVHEKDIVFGFASSLVERLEASGRYRILMTRDRDVFVPLAERVKIARDARADLFISIHADSLSNAPQVRGATVYTRADKATDSESARLAERENRADAAAGAETDEGPNGVADILQELTLRETRGFSAGFAGRLIGSMRPVMELGSKPHREAGFMVLRSPDVPSVLVELGYLSSKRDLAMLQSEEWRTRVTGSMASAVDQFFAGRSSAPAPAEPAAPDTTGATDGSADSDGSRRSLTIEPMSYGSRKATPASPQAAGRRAAPQKP